MPEGHEIHRYADLQTPIFVGKKVEVSGPNGRFEDAAVLNGKTLRGIQPVGKHLLYDFGKDRFLHVHLGRYGKFRDGPMPFPEPKGALRLRMATREHWLELRGPTACEVYSEVARVTLLARLGPDPLDPKAKVRLALDRMASSRAPIAALLMDQSVVAGIGNVYRAELLFRARLSPFRPGEAIKQPELRSIWRDAVALMKEGMVDRRMVTTRLKDRPHSRGKAIRGETHYVYRRAGLPCFVCGAKIETRDFVGRDLYWCPQCQAG